MSPRQLIVLVIAAIAAVGALLLIRGFGREAPEPEAATPSTGEQVLVAARDIGQGAALTPGDLAVASFPPETVSPGFVSVSAQPSAQTDYVGAVTRRAFVQGEPIIVSAVVQPDGRGFMAAQLDPGFRAVAIEVAPETAAGGYIQPNDRVDVIMTVKYDEGSREIVNSRIVLEDVRVLALGPDTETQTEGEGPETIPADVAVLELTAEDARILAQADRAGEIHLALRGVQVETVGIERASSSGGLGSDSMRIHAYGTASGGGQ